MDKCLKDKLLFYEREIDHLVSQPHYLCASESELHLCARVIFKDLLERLQDAVENQGQMCVTIQLLNEGRPSRPNRPIPHDWPHWSEMCQWWDDIQTKAHGNPLKKVILDRRDSKTRQAITRLFQCWSHPIIRMDISDSTTQVTLSL